MTSWISTMTMYSASILAERRLVQTRPLVSRDYRLYRTQQALLYLGVGSWV